MKIDLLIGDNTYSTVAHFSQSLGAALKRRGVETRLFWIGEGHFFHAFYEILADPPDLTCSFSNISLGNQPLADFWQIPHLSMLVDPPIYFLHQFTSQYAWVSCVDELDCAFVRALDFQRVFFLPHAADPEYKTPVERQRPYEAVFFGTCIDYEEVARSWLKSERDLLHAAADSVLSNTGLSIAQALIALGVKEADLPSYHDKVDSYTRGKDRVELIRSLDKNQVHVWGEGPWEKYLPGYSLHAPLSFDQILEVMKGSKIVLNSSPRFKSGAHERLFYALMCGASVYSGENAYLREHLPSVQTYRFGEWSPPSFEDWQERAAEGQKQVLAAHTWDVRAATLIENIFSKVLSIN